jgi:hypothetical protein
MVASKPIVRARRETVVCRCPCTCGAAHGAIVKDLCAWCKATAEHKRKKEQTKE